MVWEKVVRENIKFMKLVDHFVNTVVDELDNLNGSAFEALCRPLIEILTGREFELKGHNLEMKPVRGSVDLIEDEDFRTIGQCGTDKDYFSGGKPVDDIESSIKNSPDFKTIYLFCNRRAKGDEYQEVKAAIRKKLNEKLQTGYHYHLYDSQRIAKKIYDNIFKTKEVEEILSYLPISFEYYLLLPQNNTVPLLNTDYKHRPEEETVETLLKKCDFIQIYGLSGIGKSQLAIAVANNLYKDFDTVLWFEGGNIVPNDFKNTRIKRMGENVNLASVLKMFKTFVVVDNLNEGVGDLLTNFNQYNCKGSKCIVTSLQKNVGNENCYNLSYLSDDISRDILCDSDIRPTDKQLETILCQIKGYPLLLELSKKAVANEEMTWDEIVTESNVTGINDNEKNEVFAQRIIGRYKSRFADMFTLLHGLGSTIVCKPFLAEKSRLRLNDLVTYAISQEVSEYQCQIHQVVLSAIKTVLDKDFSEKEFLDYLLTYLKKHVESRDAALYTFMLYHQRRIVDLSLAMPTDSILRHYITLAYLYSVDTYADSEKHITMVNELQLTPEKDDVDLCLLIERIELEQNKQQKETGIDSEKYKEKVKNDIEFLKNLHVGSDKNASLIYHHLGKWLSSIGDIEQAEECLLKSLELDSHSYHSLLKLARDYNQNKEYDKAKEMLEVILKDENFYDVPISIRLSTYDLISNYKYKELKIKYIDGRLDLFSKDIYASLSEKYSQTYIVLAKLAEHLSYNFPDFYTHLCVQLPLPLNIEKNERLRKDYGKIKQAQFIYGNYSPEYKEKLYKLAESLLTSVPRNNDYIRKDLIKLYLASDEPKKYFPISEELEKLDDKFNQQLLCKVYYGIGDYQKALDYIDKAIAQENHEEPEYCAAFRHDKARCLQSLNDKKAVDVQCEAIELQPNSKLKNEWIEELATWAI